MKKILIAPDSFKETFSNFEIAKLIKERLSIRYPYEYITMPIADGGEGTLDVINNALNIQIVNKEITGPNFETITARYGIIDKEIAVIECAEVVGFNNKKETSRANNTTSYGIGEIIDECINLGLKKIYIGLGGTITSDGGCGVLCALGVKFYHQTDEFIPTGATLNDITAIDITNIHRGIEIELLSDVTNPLYGPTGASYVYAKQKGATDEEIESMDQGLKNFANLTQQLLGHDYATEASSGAAGGIGFALKAYLNGKVSSGIDKILEIIGFENEVKKCDLVITGEGKIDYQSACGKAISGVIRLSKKHNKDVVAIVGYMDGELEEFKRLGLKNVYASSHEKKSISEIRKTCVEDMCRLLGKIEL